MGETWGRWRPVFPGRQLSVSSNGSTWVKPPSEPLPRPGEPLSVSSNGSTWVKPSAGYKALQAWLSFSILERIDVGETPVLCKRTTPTPPPFSILERIDVGETGNLPGGPGNDQGLSVSSNGSTWVKRGGVLGICFPANCFQYPRTDRRG